jgi:hypothetical protein
MSRLMRLELFRLSRRRDKRKRSTGLYCRRRRGLSCAWLSQQDVPVGAAPVTRPVVARPQREAGANRPGGRRDIAAFWRATCFDRWCMPRIN